MTSRVKSAPAAWPRYLAHDLKHQADLGRARAVFAAPDYVPFKIGQAPSEPARRVAAIKSANTLLNDPQIT